MLHTITSIDQYLATFGADLARLTAKHVTCTWDGTLHPGLAALKRPPLGRQAAVISAAIANWRHQPRQVLACEPGCGKSFMGVAACHVHANAKPYLGIVMCPGQLVLKWKREISATIDANAVVITDWRELVPRIGRPIRQPTWLIMSQTTAKLRPATALALDKGKCPTCGQKTAPDGRRPTCEHCGDRLWSWVPKPRRWPAAKIIADKFRPAYAIIDEVHEAKASDSCNGQAAAWLMNAARRSLCLTGTLLAGKAEDVRSLLFRLAPRQMASRGFTWANATKFTATYGRHETTIKANGRTIKRVRQGIMPGLFPDLLMDKCLFMRLEEIASALPPYSETLYNVTLDADTADALAVTEKRLRKALTNTMLAGRPDMRILGQLVELLLHYPDYPHGWGDITLPEVGTICSPINLPVKTMPKDIALVEYVRSQMAAGRRTWVYAHRHRAQERLVAALTAANIPTTLLTADVPPADREKWMRQHGPPTWAMVSHPNLVRTGLEFFGPGYNFPTIAWYDQSFDLTTYRQASRRAWRIGQPEPCEVAMFYYGDTMQQHAVRLIAAKLAAAEAIDGQFTKGGILDALADTDAFRLMAQAVLARLNKEDA